MKDNDRGIFSIFSPLAFGYAITSMLSGILIDSIIEVGGTTLGMISAGPIALAVGLGAFGV